MISHMNGGCVGRDEQLHTLRSFMDGSSPVGCLVLVGDAGIGKTTVWEEGLRLASGQGFRVLSTRASQAEATLSFAALADLVAGVGPDPVVALPSPQRHALQVAIRLAEPHGTAPEPLAISSGFLNLLRAAAEAEPMLVAIDDVQWLDPSSAESLLFTARRLANRVDRRIRFLLSRRPGRSSALEATFRTAGLERVTLGPLSVGAIQHLLSERLGLVPVRRVLRQVYEVSQGNPLFALELGRTLIDYGMPEPGAELPVLDVADDLFGTRVRALAGPVRRALLATALSADIGWHELSRLADPLGLDAAVTSGLVTVDRLRARPAHPLLGAAVRQIAGVAERRALHADLASAIDDPVLAARHRALAATGPDLELARTVGVAAVAASDRGAAQEAKDLAAQALRLTPADSAEYHDRLLALARFHLTNGAPAAVRDLLAPRLQDLPLGLPRARAHLLLASAVADAAAEEIHLELALAEAGDNPEIRAIARVRQSITLSVASVRRLGDADRLAREALVAAGAVTAELRHRALTALAWARILRGQPIDDLRGSAPPSPVATRFYEDSVDRPFGVQLAFRGEVGRARNLFQRISEKAEEHGDVRGRIALSIQLCELELRAGDVRRACEHLDDLEEWSAHDDVLLVIPRLRALVAALTGLPAEADKHAAVVLQDPSALESATWNFLESIRAAGIAALFDHDPGRAADHLRTVWEHTRREQVDDPGAFPVAGDLVEALVLCGERDAARAVTDQLSLLAERQRHPWGGATASRCSALLRLTDDYDDAAAARLTEAAAAYADLGLRYEHGRTLLLLGRVQRRFNKRSAARLSLAEARAIFDALGCLGWSAQATAELSRVSGRRVAEDTLTVSERRVAEMAASGLSNKEIAGQLYVSVYTVEAHLSHAYAKLGVHSRGQLAARLANTR